MKQPKEYIYKEIEDLNYVLKSSDYFSYNSFSWDRIIEGGGISGFSIATMRKHHPRIKHYAQRKAASTLFKIKKPWPYGY